MWRNSGVSMMMLLAGFCGGEQRVADHRDVARDSEIRRLNAENQRLQAQMAQAQQAKAVLADTMQAIEQSLLELGAQRPAAISLGSDIESGLQQASSQRDDLRQMIEQLAGIQQSFEERAKAAETKLNDARAKLQGVDAELQKEFGVRIETAATHLRQYIEENEQLRESIARYHIELENARKRIEEQDQTIAQQQQQLDEQQQVILDQQTQIVEASRGPKHRIRVDTLRNLLQVGLLRGCRFCKKVANCAACGCQEGELDADGTLPVPAPYHRVTVFSHPKGMYSVVATGPFTSIIRVPDVDAFWAMNDCLVIGY